MAININDIDDLYKKYGYIIKKPTEDVRIYIFQQGVYYGVDIFPLKADADTEQLKQSYAKSGYASRVTSYSSLAEAEEKLYNGFFSFTQTEKRIKERYHDYIDSRTKSLGASYEYIPSSFDILTQEDNDKTTLTNYIIKKISQPGAQLIIIEAAAGFGKTSTAYEILHNATTTSLCKNPILAELSRNRQARIFRYVLLDEIDREYPSLKSDLVIHEIQTGRIPLIIDGFDELLQKSNSAGEQDDSFESVEEMLETISSILQDNAKVILTSRCTAIFAGDEFCNWIDKKSESFETTRILLHKPDAVSWLGATRFKHLEKNNIPIDYIGNPVLLSFLRSLDSETFTTCCLDSESIVQRFFSSLLEREIERQKLIMTTNEQLSVFQNLAKDFVAYGITSEDKNFVGSLLLDANRNLLNEIRNRYKSELRPSIEELVETLTNHALLDRVGGNEESIAFINQYVFGYFIGQCACAADEDWLLDHYASPDYIELSATTFSTRSPDAKSCLHQKICLVEDVLDARQKLFIDQMLIGTTHRSFNNAAFDEMSFDKFIFSDDSTLNYCYFSDCSFTRVTIPSSALNNTTFINSTFRDCIFQISEYQPHSGTAASFINCNDFNSGFITNISTYTREQNIIPMSSTKNYKLEVLRQFWPVGRPNAANSRKLRTLYAGFKPSEHYDISNAIKELNDMDIISQSRSFVSLNNTKMNEIRSLLGY